MIAQGATASSMLPVGRDTVTGEDGTFTVTGLSAREYVVRIAPSLLDQLNVVDDSDEGWKSVDRDIEAVFWPSVPVSVPGGSITNLGTIPVRTIPYYKARIRVEGDCKEGEKWLLTVVKLPYDGSKKETRVGGTACRSVFLISGLAPGSYLLGRRVDELPRTPVGRRLLW